jgi:hypothetical protein
MPVETAAEKVADTSVVKQLRPVLPDVDMWIKAFSKQMPEPLVVHAFKQAVEQRRIFLFGLVRQAVLARTINERQFARLSRALAGFPDVPILSRDHVRAAERIQQARANRMMLSPWQALAWTVAERTGACIWSTARHWSPLTAAGCPVVSTITNG